MIKKTFFTFFLILLSIGNLSAYIHTINTKGKNVKWANSSGNLEFYLNVSGCDSVVNNCNASTVRSIMASSASQWSSTSNFNINVSTTSSTNSSGINTISFSSNSSLFGSGVVAVTQISYKEDDGKILEADIVINSGFVFDTVTSEPEYLGNVVTHEMGHMLGLAHGQVFRSSMFYSLTQGQSTLSDDDKSGVKNLYGLDTNAGSISGKIIGGPTKVAIFGAHVQAISSTTGIIKSAALSKEDGTFKLTNLDLDDIYYIYVGPTKLTTSTLPEYYRNIKSNFCNSSQNFRGSFFQTCNNSEKGEPQEIYLSSSRKNVDVGNVTIRCNLDVPVDYSIAKEVSAYDLEALDVNNKISYAQTGFFSSTEATNNTEDEFSLDLTSYPVTRTDLYLEVRVLSQVFYSQTVSSLEITNALGTTTSYPLPGELDSTGVPYDTDLAPRLDLVGRYLLSTTASNNDFTIKITPKKFSDYLTAINTPTFYWTEEDFFPISSKLSDNLLFYLLIVNVVKSNGDGTYSRYSMPTPTNVSDNSYCPDAARSYTTAGNFSISDSNQVIKSTKSNPIACGSIDIDNSDDNNFPGSGTLSFLLGCFMVIFIFSVRKPSFKKF